MILVHTSVIRKTGIALKLFTADSENLVRAPFLKKNWVAGPKQPWSIASGVYNRDGGRYWSCTLVHTPIICIYGRPMLLHVSVKLRRLQACAALSVMQRRATMSSTRSKHGANRTHS